jgi:TusA-related sulfurtransferase
MHAPSSGELTAPQLTVIAGAIARREFARLAEVFDPKIEFRALTPDGLREASDAEGAIAWFVEWFGRGFAQEVVLNEQFPIGGRIGLRYRLRRQLGRTLETAESYLIEQHGFADAGPLGIERLSLVCSGNTLERAAASAGGMHEFDAGDMGCGDGLPQEFMRRIRAIPIGDVLHVITSDPSARQDLPSLARMNGHAIEPPQELEGGRTLFVIERRK